MLSTKIPIRTDVKEVLEYIGFKPEAAEDISQRWRLPPEGPWDPMDTAHHLVDELESPRYAGLKLRDAMSRVGLKDEVAAPILDPEFRDLLDTQGLCFWIKDTLDTNYETLLCRQKLLKRHANKVMAQKSRRERDGLEKTSRQGKQSSATINLRMEDFKLPAAHVSVIEGDPQPVLPDHVVLYRGMAYCHHYPNDQIVKNDGSIQLLKAHNRRYNGDFNEGRSGYYWAEEKKTAERYRKWAALRCPTSDTCIIQIQVRRTFLDQLVCFTASPFNTWKDFVWNLRNYGRYGELPDHLKEVKNADLIKGYTYTGRSRIKGKSLTKLTSDNLLRCPSTGRPAIQWMFTLSGWPAIDRLNAEVRGNVHLDLFAATKLAAE
ncbi:uncharacterized protein LDX57_007050 [Aspergillus melleus]|uniref:uncharacterized protein n=1 Tax=Aspergillus melleus TaxID=138277 RepID=UPI001E8D6D0C|nr:uncharacterized protein LDX57_007050 [Aspergillus melleus]KAH8429386.1 hypothetical protein LDX57_007050 [Aspergillus melleus]